MVHAKSISYISKTIWSAKHIVKEQADLKEYYSYDTKWNENRIKYNKYYDKCLNTVMLNIFCSMHGIMPIPKYFISINLSEETQSL